MTLESFLRWMLDLALMACLIDRAMAARKWRFNYERAEMKVTGIQCQKAELLVMNERAATEVAELQAELIQTHADDTQKHIDKERAYSQTLAQREASLNRMEQRISGIKDVVCSVTVDIDRVLTLLRGLQ